MPRPDFFIVGAPKCGTTAMTEYLSSHPEIFMSTPKEPHFFATDFPRNRYVEDLDDYLKLFDTAPRECRRVGEASVWYLYSKTALEAIKAFQPDARIVVMLRNPVDMAVSLHAENLYNFNEEAEAFMTAYGLQAERAAGQALPAQCRNPIMLQYTRLGCYSTWLSHLFGLFQRDRVHVVILEDFNRDADGEYRRLLAFLGLNTDGRVEFPKINERKTYRFKRIGFWLQHPPARLRILVAGLRQHTGIDLRRPALWLRRLVSRPAGRATLDPAARARVLDDFQADIDEVERLLGRRLDAWRV
jgi:hypothetical protein